MKTVQQWLDDYSQSHRNPTNKQLHWVCVPLIVFSVFCALKWLPFGDARINAASVFAVLAVAYYFLLSWRLALGMVLIFGLMYALTLDLEARLGAAFLPFAIAVFVLAWVGQFIGHHIEGRKPSFFKDLQFLLIGPLWLLADVYQRRSWKI